MCHDSNPDRSMNRSLPLLLTLLVAGAPAFAADAVEGEVLAFDRHDRVIVLKDKSVFPLDRLEKPLPKGLKAGDRVEIRYESNEDDGVWIVHGVEVLD